MWYIATSAYEFYVEIHIRMTAAWGPPRAITYENPDVLQQLRGSFAISATVGMPAKVKIQKLLILARLSLQ